MNWKPTAMHVTGKAVPHDVEVTYKGILVSVRLNVSAAISVEGEIPEVDGRLHEDTAEIFQLALAEFESRQKK